MRRAFQDDRQPGWVKALGQSRPCASETRGQDSEQRHEPQQPGPLRRVPEKDHGDSRRRYQGMQNRRGSERSKRRRGAVPQACWPAPRSPAARRACAPWRRVRPCERFPRRRSSPRRRQATPATTSGPCPRSCETPAPRRPRRTRAAPRWSPASPPCRAPKKIDQRRVKAREDRVVVLRAMGKEKILDQTTRGRVCAGLAPRRAWHRG